MALYDYRCGCGSEFEARFPIGQAPSSIPCPCGKGMGKRILRTPPVIFRPEGWDRSPEDPDYWKGLVEAEAEKLSKPKILKQQETRV